MLKKDVWGVLAAVVVMGLHAEGLLAAPKPVTYVVSQTGKSCDPTRSGPLYPVFATIQAALTAIPSAPFATNTVLVCPGTYPEQIRITKNVTITGLLLDGTDPVATWGNSNEAKIVPPATMLPFSPASGSGPVAAQVVAENVADLQIINMTIDGTGIGCPVVGVLPVRTAGIAFYNVGIKNTNAKGTVSDSVVHNQIGMCGGVRSYSADGIVLENSIATVTSSSLSNIDVNIVNQTGGISIITSNFLNFGWHGIVLTHVVDTTAVNNVGSTISGNHVTSFMDGIHLVASRNVLMSENIFLSWTGSGIWLTGLSELDLSSDNDITGNTVVDAEIGINLIGALRNVVHGNTIVRPIKAGIADISSHGDNQITGNTINQAAVGIWGYQTSNDTINPNVFYNVGKLTFAADGPP